MENPLTADQMVKTLQSVFVALGELRVEGKQVEIFNNIRTGVASVNNSLVFFMEQSSKANKDKTQQTNGEAVDVPAAA